MAGRVTYLPDAYAIAPGEQPMGASDTGYASQRIIFFCCFFLS